MATLVGKLLRDVWVAWGVVALLLFAFQVLWARITDRVTNQILQAFGRFGLTIDQLNEILFEEGGPGQIAQAIIGGESIRADRAMDMLSIAYVHPLTQTVLCLWAVGRAAGAIAGEIDRGTMELLLAQPVRRGQLVGAHFLVDLITIPGLCLSIWLGTAAGVWLMGWVGAQRLLEQVALARFAPALLNVAGLVFAVNGLTMWLSSMERSRTRVWGLAVSLALVQFFVNVLGQLWPAIEFLRPFTVFYYYQPQPIILDPAWAAKPEIWGRLAVLFAVGAGGYVLAWVTFTRRDLPAPL
jgi:ABC-2 type transport system permease protein